MTAGRATAVAHDVVLSSGFLAFAQHAGFLQAVEEVSSAQHQAAFLCMSSLPKPHGGLCTAIPAEHIITRPICRPQLGLQRSLCLQGNTFPAVCVVRCAGAGWCACGWRDGHQCWSAHRQPVCSRLQSKGGAGTMFSSVPVHVHLWTACTAHSLVCNHASPLILPHSLQPSLLHPPPSCLVCWPL